MSRFFCTKTTLDNNSGPAATMEQHVVKRILAALLLATCALSANAANLAPTVGITAPDVNATYVAPAMITLSANAADSDGSIQKVEFFNGETLLATVTQAPYTYVWTDVAAGSYVLTAKATDNLDLAATSANQTVTVTASAGPAQVFYIFSDQINTAREITNSAGVKVWQADPEPFGANLPNENPAALGQFIYNPRFPGQYYDRETGLHYNYYRDYDPQTGRYVQSDPIGLKGGINTYVYVNLNLLGNVDPTGEFGLPGFALGAAGNFAFQMVTNYASLPGGGTYFGNLKKSFRCVDWTGVGIGGALGATGLPGFVGAGSTLVKGALGKVTASVAGEAAAKYALIGAPIGFGVNSIIPDVRIGDECECKNVGGLGGAYRGVF